MRLIRRSQFNDLRTQLTLETQKLVERARSSDGVEVERAFVERREPRFTGE